MTDREKRDLHTETIVAPIDIELLRGDFND
jgi:hypothetical protein